MFRSVSTDFDALFASKRFEEDDFEIDWFLIDDLLTTSPPGTGTIKNGGSKRIESFGDRMKPINVPTGTFSGTENVNSNCWLRWLGWLRRWSLDRDEIAYDEIGCNKIDNNKNNNNEDNDGGDSDDDDDGNKLTNDNLERFNDFFLFDWMDDEGVGNAGICESMIWSLQ